MIYLQLILTAFFWGGTFIAGKLLASEIHPLTASLLRFSVATIALYLILSWRGNKPSLPEIQYLPRLLLLGLSGIFCYNIFFFHGLSHIDAGRAALIIATTPLVITLLSIVILRERITLLKGAGVCISLFGALFVISNGHPTILFSQGIGIGERSLIGCVLSWAAYTIIGRTLVNKIPPILTVFYSSALGTLLLLIPSLWLGLVPETGNLSMTGWLCILYLGVFGTAIGFSWYYQGLNRIGATRSAIFINLVPVFGMSLSVLIFSESIKSTVITGGILIICGIYLANKKH
ncbi:MAG: DMT family transporter [Desulfobulbaceae bacterium]|mgnify:FL=1|nr:MAG: DMT family transporter [Desulfobulbaceae bacterium]